MKTVRIVDVVLSLESLPGKGKVERCVKIALTDKDGQVLSSFKVSHEEIDTEKIMLFGYDVIIKKLQKLATPLFTPRKRRLKRRLIRRKE